MENPQFRSNLRQTPTCSKLSLPNYRYLVPIYSMCRDSRLAAVVGRMLKCQSWLWKSGVYHLLSIYHIYIEVRIHFSASECLLSCSSKLFYMYSNCIETRSNCLCQFSPLLLEKRIEIYSPVEVLSSGPTPKWCEGTDKADGSSLRPELATTMPTLTFNSRRVQYWKTAMKIIEKVPKGSEGSMRLASWV